MVDLKNEIHITSDNQLNGVIAPGFKPTPWLTSYRKCMLLTHYSIVHAGIVKAALDYRVFRFKAPFTYVLATISGEGLVRSGGKSARLKYGQACIFPEGSTYEDRASGSKQWEFCYVCYQHGQGNNPMVTASLPLITSCSPETLLYAIAAMESECQPGGSPECQRHLLEVIHSQTLKYCRPWRQDDRLFHLWQKVATSLNEPWDTKRLCETSGYSSEHLRRLCKKQLGCGLSEHLTFLRMRRAAELLVTTNFKVEHIAIETGYKDPFAFSVAFKRWAGMNPTEYRTHSAS